MREPHIVTSTASTLLLYCSEQVVFLAKFPTWEARRSHRRHTFLENFGLGWRKGTEVPWLAEMFFSETEPLQLRNSYSGNASGNLSIHTRLQNCCNLRLLCWLSWVCRSQSMRCYSSLCVRNVFVCLLLLIIHTEKFTRILSQLNLC